MTWDPERYLQYADERGRPFVELLARVGARAPGLVVDLGCGPGNLTALLAGRWPEARIMGLDSSAEMIARASADHPGIEFGVQDLRDWASVEAADAAGEPVDVLVSNATLQWVPGHLELLPGLLGRVRAGGWVALQVPGNFEEPSHTLRRELMRQPPYVDHLAGAAEPSAHDATTYLGALREMGCDVDAWETTYLHVLTGADPVLDWIRGTSLRPALQALPDDLTGPFVADLRERLRAAYPQPVRRGHRNGVILPFRRVFVVARKPRAEEAA